MPEVGIHRGRVHLALWRAAVERVGVPRIRGDSEPVVSADLVIACDGVNSAVRRRFYPGEELRFAGINSGRGVTRREPLSSPAEATCRTGSVRRGNLVTYPIVDDCLHDTAPCSTSESMRRLLVLALAGLVVASAVVAEEAAIRLEKPWVRRAPATPDARPGAEHPAGHVTLLNRGPRATPWSRRRRTSQRRVELHEPVTCPGR